ncbi:hypothetical protein PIB30_066122 [Stylosanthes scabra]|uniref:Putative plant transposon protein domain-containing protein n=1 Tax=Stylosanthes scabra TaxID=79078 RepID=A0ABU6WLU9_9FABA|nr:hypothetical protein [Stylosanthes scabra]
MIARWPGLLSDQVRSPFAPSHVSARSSHESRNCAVSPRDRVIAWLLSGESLPLARNRAPQAVRSHEPKITRYGPPIRARTRTSGPCDRAVLLHMACKGKEAAASSTPSRSRTTKNSSRGRDDGFLADLFDSIIHYDRWKTMENRGYTHERIIHLSKGESDFWHDRIEGLGWGFMYNAFISINVTLVREFCANFSTNHQDTIFLRRRRILFTENDIREYLNINIDLPGSGMNDAFKEATERRKENNLDLGLVFSVIGRQDTNWANNPVDDTIPERKLDNAILNAQATTWHKLIIANVDPKQHGTTFDLNHAILIYVLMTEGVVNLPRIMRDVLLKRLTGNSRNLLPYPIFISRLASRFQVPVFAGDVFYEVREQDMFYPYGDWKVEQPKVRRGRVIPPPQPLQVQQEEQQQPPPAASEIPSTSAQHLSEPSLQEIMRHLERQERLLHRQVVRSRTRRL